MKKSKNSQFVLAWRRLRRNKMAMFGLALLIIIVLSAVFAPLIAQYGINDQDFSRRFKSPCAEYPFGTDSYGRDIFSRVLYGGRVTLTIAFTATLITGVGGLLLGAIAGFYGGKLDSVIMRGLDVLMAMPALLLAITIAAVMGGGLFSALLAVGIADIPGMARLVRSTILGVRNQEYIEAAYSINASNRRILLRHVLPNALSPIIVQLTMNVASAILTASTLSFLGLGVQAPSPEWGAMLSNGKEFLGQYWWITTIPGLMIMLSVFSIKRPGRRPARRVGPETEELGVHYDGERSFA